LLSDDELADCFEESLSEQNQVAAVGRLFSKWLEKRTSAAKAVKRKLFTARLKPCPSSKASPT
jgi:hypothetical protein